MRPQPTLFDVEPTKPKPRAPNRTADGELACAFGTPWLDHANPPIGTGKGCTLCDNYQGEEK